MSLGLNFNDQLDFNGLASRERCHTNRGACMPASLAEDLDHQVRETIDDLGCCTKDGSEWTIPRTALAQALALDIW